MLLLNFDLICCHFLCFKHQGNSVHLHFFRVEEEISQIPAHKTKQQTYVSATLVVLVLRNNK